MYGDPAGGLYAHGADFSGVGFSGIQPDACFALASFAFQAVFCHGADDYFFQIPHVAVDVGKEILQIQHGIAYYLPETVVGDVAASVGFHICGVYFIEFLLVYQHMMFVARFPESIYMRMLYEEEVIGRFLLCGLLSVLKFEVYNPAHELFLIIPSRLIVHQT